MTDEVWRIMQHTATLIVDGEKTPKHNAKEVCLPNRNEWMHYGSSRHTGTKIVF